MNLFSQSHVRLLDVDPDLGQGLSAGDFAEARRMLRLPTLWVEGPEWDPSPVVALAQPGWLGLYVVSGLMVRIVRVESRGVAELFGPGDVLRPWDADGEYAPVTVSLGWRVLDPVRLGLMDAGVSRAAGAWPAISAALMSRVAFRARKAALQNALSQLPRADSRVLMLFWILAEEWGRMTQDGIRIELPVTHELLAMLTGLRRPAVTLALGSLTQTGLLRRENARSWLITHAARAHLGVSSSEPAHAHGDAATAEPG